jgi:hypothetical protein
MFAATREPSPRFYGPVTVLGVRRARLSEWWRVYPDYLVLTAACPACLLTVLVPPSWVRVCFEAGLFGDPTSAT